MFEISFKEESCAKYGVIPVRRPDIPAPEERIEEISVPGRDGILTSSEGLYDTIVIPVEMNFMCSKRDWSGVYRKAKKWLSGSGKLRFSDDPGYFYKALFCRVTSTERTSWRIGKFTAEFTCDPYIYSDEGEKEFEASDSIYNPGAVCHPLYRIAGEGLCTLTVNGYEFTANVGQEIIIDSDRQISYKNDGQSLNTDVTGDYAKLWLPPGDNTVTGSDGFAVSITPKWREL